MFYTLKEDDKVHSVSSKGNKTLMYHIMRNKWSARALADSERISMLNAKNLKDSAKSITTSVEATDNVQCMDVNGCASGDSPVDVVEITTDIVTAEPSVTGDIINDDTKSKTVDTVDADDDDEYDDISEGDESTASASSMCSSTSNPSSQMKKKCGSKKGGGGGGSIQTKLLKKKKLRKSRRKEDVALWEHKPGDRITAEVLSTMSYAEVMWQVRVMQLVNSNYVLSTSTVLNVLFITC